MKREKVTLKALLALCMAALAALVIAGCAGSSGTSSAESASGSGDGSGDASRAATGVGAILGGSGDSSRASGSAGSSGSSSASVPYINSGSSASSASSGSSGTGASSSSATTASDTLVEVMNDEGGYLFEVDKAFITETSGQSTTVYTGSKSGAVPYFKLTLMGNRTGRSVDDLLASTADKIVEDYGDRIVVEPTFNVVDLGNRKIAGFEHVYKTESGSDTLYAMTYVEDIDSTFYTWTGVYYSGDGTTPAAMQQAATTLMVRS